MVDCQVCRGQERRLTASVEHIDSGRVFNVYSCAGCGLGVLTPMPSKEELTEYYHNYYTEEGPKERDQSLKEVLKRVLFKGTRHKIGLVRYVCSTLASLSMQVVLPPPFGQKRVLEVGCGYGRLLNLFQQQGWETYGVEPGPQASQLARQRGHKVFTGELLEAKYQSAFFSSVVFCQSLEHIPNPLEVLLEAYRILSPGGILAVDVPNANSIDARFFGSAWDAWVVPYHLYHWTPSSLKKAVTSVGFVPIRWKYKTPTRHDFKANIEKLRNIEGGTNQGIFTHILRTWLLGHLGFKGSRYGRFMALYSQKPLLIEVFHSV